MPRKKKYENAEIVKRILEREFNNLGDLQGCMIFKFLDFKKKEDRDYLKDNINQMIELFQEAVKELEG